MEQILKDIQNNKPFVYDGLDGNNYRIARKDFDWRIEKENGWLIRRITFEQVKQIIFDCTDLYNKAQIQKAVEAQKEMRRQN